jgi:hypothetical protein
VAALKRADGLIESDLGRRGSPRPNRRGRIEVIDSSDGYKVKPAFSTA